jgi:hypothetical protein
VAFAKALFGTSHRRDRRIDERVQSTALEISLDGEVYRTVDWSLSGVLLADYYGSRGTGDEVEGSVQITRDMSSFPFKAVVIRRDPTMGQLALNFTDLGASGFSALEAMIMGRYGI